ncbi:hypothetical protein DLJ96_14805 [Actinotalea fermentans ATCC 43279 = JCM 9966 = DSM 3133]|nr:hypothetical protein DLJ96_14805 [Actinotalea fermentans ATCC 43279 = JCM 9966 = DSM 3133]
MTGVTRDRVDRTVHLPVMFSKSARQGETDTTAKLLGAAAKWPLPRTEIRHLELDASRLQGLTSGIDLHV